jgi:hypothetical protein
MIHQIAHRFGATSARRSSATPFRHSCMFLVGIHVVKDGSPLRACGDDVVKYVAL